LKLRAVSCESGLGHWGAPLACPQAGFSPVFCVNTDLPRFLLHASALFGSFARLSFLCGKIALPMMCGVLEHAD